MVAVQTSPNASPSAEWICCLDKRCVDVIPSEPRSLFPRPSVSFSRFGVIQSQPAVAACAARNHDAAFVVAHKKRSISGVVKLVVLRVI